MGHTFSKLSERYASRRTCADQEHIFATTYLCVDRGALNILTFLARGQLGDIFLVPKCCYAASSIGIASAERSFSTLRRLKTRLRNTMKTERTSN